MVISRVSWLKHVENDSINTKNGIIKKVVF